MSTKIEQGIEELEEYIQSCPYAAFSKTKILVERDEIEDLIAELKERIPDEVKKYQKIISQKEAILVNAQEQAAKLIQDAESRRSQMTSQNVIMQEAYRKAEEIERQALEQAEAGLRAAEEQAQGITYSAMQYTDGALADIQDILSSAIINVRDLNTKLIGAMSESLNRVYADRAQLHPQDDEVIANQAIAEREQRAAAAAAAAAALQEQQAAGADEAAGMAAAGPMEREQAAPVRMNSVGQNSVPVQEQVQAQAQAQVQVQQQGAAGINPVNRANAVSTVQGAVKQPEKSQITSINGQGRVSQGNGSRGKRR